MSVHRYGKYRVTNKATGEVHYLSAEELARIPSGRARRRGKVIEIRDIPEKGYVRGGKHYAREPRRGHHADIVPNVSIRLFGVETNRVNGPLHYDRTFRIGDTAVYGGFNLTYTGTIVAIGAKVVAIKEPYSQNARVHKLSIAQFSRWNDTMDLDQIAKRNSEWMD